jgi:hypothetical protein
MDYPEAIIFLEAEHLLSVLIFCQVADIDVTDGVLCGHPCLFLYEKIDVDVILLFMKNQYGIEPYYMVDASAN